MFLIIGLAKGLSNTPLSLNIWVLSESLSGGESPQSVLSIASLETIYWDDAGLTT